MSWWRIPFTHVSQLPVTPLTVPLLQPSQPPPARAGSRVVPVVEPQPIPPGYVDIGISSRAFTSRSGDPITPEEVALYFLSYMTRVGQVALDAAPRAVVEGTIANLRYVAAVISRGGGDRGTAFYLRDAQEGFNYLVRNGVIIMRNTGDLVLVGNPQGNVAGGDESAGESSSEDDGTDAELTEEPSSDDEMEI